MTDLAHLFDAPESLALYRVKRERDALREQLQGAVRLTDAERERVLWWLYKPAPPGPLKALDEAIIRKLEAKS